MSTNKYIIKRDGRKVLYNRRKIENAMEKAFIAKDGEIDDYADQKIKSIANFIEDKIFSEDKEFTVEEIQDLVQVGLMNTKRKDVAEEFIIYRNDRNRTRMGNTSFMKEVGEKLMASNVQNQNANIDEHSYGGRMGEARNVLTKKYALDYLVSPLTRKRHLRNEIYTHDFDSWAVGMHNCMSIPFDQLLKNGFNTRQTDVRPANSIGTALQLVAVLFQLQSLQQFGGCSATHLDWTLVPYFRLSFFKHYLDGLKYIEDYTDEQIREFNNKYSRDNIKNISIEDTTLYDIDSKPYKFAMEKTIKETNQAVEGMYHNLNTLQSRSGNQLPFTSINYGTCTLIEGRLIIKSLLDGSIKGVGRLHKTSIFPCGIFQLGKGINERPGDPNYDLFQLALESTSKRLYPNYANIDWSGNKGYDKNDPSTYFSTMGCRTANGYDINGLGQRKDGRGNICPVTIIMPTIAMEAKEKFLEENPESEDNEKLFNEYFIPLLDNMIHDAREILIERFEYICSQPMESARFMYENNIMAGYIPEEGTRSALKHGTLAIGQIGLAETLQILIGTDHTEEFGMEHAKIIEQLFKDRAAEFKKADKLNFGVYYTPAENLCYTAMKNFKSQYGKIKNVSDREYFTNSMHCPVWKEISPFEKINIESQLTGYSSAGCITYCEFDAVAQYNIKALESVVLYAMDHDIPYFAINIPNDTCLDCGYTGEFNDECPVCHSKHIQQLRRVTGYLTGDFKSAFNKGKQEEVNDRYKHTKKLRFNN